MRVSLCINGTFRYPDYARFYAEAGALAQFHFAHRRGSTAKALGVAEAQVHNIWPKHYLHAAAFRAPPGPWRDRVMQGLCDTWQAAVLRCWQPSDSLECVIGGLADRIVARAARENTPVLGHAVTSHPADFHARVETARADLGLRPRRARPGEMARRHEEIAGCTAVLADSVAVARGYVAEGVPASRLVVVRPGFDPSRFHPRGPDAIARDRFRVVCVGLITPRKGQHVLLRAWHRAALPDAELLLVGTAGPEARAVMATCPPGVVHHGHVDHRALRAVLSSAACLVLPSIEDGFGQAALEAMACGVPVILSDAVGASELVRHGESGLVVPPLDAEVLAEALVTLYRDPDRVVAMGTAAAAAVADLAGWPAYVAQVLALHRRMVAGLPVSAEAAAA